MSGFLGGSASGGGMTGPPQAGIGTQAASSGGWSSMDTFYTASALSGVGKAWNQIAASRQQAQVAEHNAEMMKLEARYQDLRSDIEKNKLRRRTARLRGAQRAAYSAGGVNPDVGTPAEVGRETWEQTEEDADMIDMQAESAAAGYRSRAADYGYTADTSMSTGMTRAGTSLLSSTRKMRRI